MKWIIYELRIWNQVKLWSSQLWTQFFSSNPVEVLNFSGGLLYAIAKIAFITARIIASLEDYSGKVWNAIYQIISKQWCFENSKFYKQCMGSSSIFYLYFRSCTIMFSTFFLAYPSFFHLKKCNLFQFGPLALWLRMEESAVIFAAYDVHLGRHARAPHVEAVFWLFVVNIEWLESAQKISTASFVITLFLLIAKSLFPISYVTAGCWFRFWPHTEKAELKAGKAQLRTQFSHKKQKTRRNNPTYLTLLMLGFPETMLEKLLILAFSSPLKLEILFYFFYLNILPLFAPKAPRLIKGAHNNTVIRLTNKTYRHTQHTKLQQRNLLIY